VRVNGSERTTTFDSGTQLRATLTAAHLASAGSRTITVFTPAPGGGTSNGVIIAVPPGWSLGGSALSNFVATPPASAATLELAFNDGGWLAWFQALRASGVMTDSQLADVILYVYLGNGFPGLFPSGVWP
jgi:hypothetical protein